MANYQVKSVSFDKAAQDVYAVEFVDVERGQNVTAFDDDKDLKVDRFSSVDLSEADQALLTELFKTTIEETCGTLGGLNSIVRHGLAQKSIAIKHATAGDSYALTSGTKYYQVKCLKTEKDEETQSCVRLQVQETAKNSASLYLDAGGLSMNMSLFYPFVRLPEVK